MEYRCMKCSRKDVCDDVTWEMDEHGAMQIATGIEGCDRFDIHPDSVLEFIAEQILATDVVDGDYIDIKVSRDISTIQVSLILFKNLTTQDKVQRMQELQAMLQEINDEVLHIDEAEFLIHFVYTQLDNPQIPNNLPENLSAHPNLFCPDYVETATTTFDPGVHKDEEGKDLCDGCGLSKDEHELRLPMNVDQIEAADTAGAFKDMEEVAPQSECPVCETTMTDECSKCGFKW